VSIMTAGQKKFMESAADPSEPAAALGALTAGIQNAFIFAMVVAIIGLVIALFIRRVNIQKESQTVNVKKETRSA
ncbi:hypothetical protein K0U00_28635, partial [Paenibacillus sepulcri]|nr:hypothetical protein [Paenibacillus sepulcri]